MRLMKNKKGIFFTILAIAILSLFLISYTLYSSAQERKAVQKRIATLNNFVFSVEKDLPRQVYISGFRIILLFEEKIVESGEYTTNFEPRFNEAFFNGTFDGSTVAIMQEATFPDINEHLQESAAKINAFANLTNPSITVSQDNPWSVKVSLTADLFVKDNSNLALWNRTAEIVAYIPIEYFEDPIYVVGTGGAFSIKINRTVYDSPIGADLSNLLDHAEKFYYINTTISPSFLDRLQGNLDARSPYGIESIVDRTNQDIPDNGDKSIVDYIYFSENNPDSCNIEGMPSWFKLDNEHLSVYGVSCV